MAEPRLLAVRDRRNHAARRAMTERVYGEFCEMPCLRLTPPQARRLFGLRPDVCDRILLALVQTGSLVYDDERYRLNEARRPATRVPAA